MDDNEAYQLAVPIFVVELIDDHHMATIKSIKWTNREEM